LEYVEVDPYVFEERDGASRIAFVSHDDGMHLLSSDFTTDHLRKIGPIEQPLVHVVLLGGSLLVALSGVFGWPLAALYYRVRRGRRPHGATYDPDVAPRFDGGRQLPVTATGARVLAGAAAIAVFTTLAGLVYAVSADSLAFLTGFHPLLGPVTTLPVVAGVLLVGAVVAGYSARAAPDWGRIAKVHFALVVVAVGVLLAELAVYNLVLV
jgi:hypothetical protein